MVRQIHRCPYPFSGCKECRAEQAKWDATATETKPATWVPVTDAITASTTN